MADLEKDLKAGVCAVLGAETYLEWQDPALLTFRPYTADEVGLYDGVLPAEPAAAVMVNTYPVQAYPVPVIGVQFHIAALDPDEATRAAQAIHDTLEGRWGGTLGSVRLVSAAWQSGTPLGQDANGRRGRTENYYLTIYRTSPQRE